MRYCRQNNIKNDSLTSYKQLDSSGLCDLLLIGLTLRLKVLCISIQDVSIGWINVDVLEEVVPHVGVVAFWMSTREPWRTKVSAFDLQCHESSCFQCLVQNFKYKIL